MNIDDKSLSLPILPLPDHDRAAAARYCHDHDAADVLAALGLEEFL